MAKRTSSYTGLIALFIKLGAKLAPIIPKLLTTAKATKLVFAALTVGSYALIFTWQFALVITAMLVIHEYGHLFVMRRFGMKTKGLYLIPFVGAAAVAEGTFPTRKAEAYIAMAGPVTGGALSLLCALAFLVTHNPFLAAIAGWGALLNLFNLLPIVPLDGGRVVKSVTMSIGSKLGLGVMIGGMVLAGVLAFAAHFWILVIMIPIGLLEFIFERRSANKNIIIEDGVLIRPKEVMSKAMTRNMFLVYLGLAAGLCVLMLVMSSQPGADAAMQILEH